MRIVQQPMLNKRIPSFLGFFFLIMAIVTITWLSRNTIFFGTFAANDNIPRDVEISNISDVSFTVSYVTDANVVGTITFGTAGKMDQVILDSRDTSQNTPTEYTTHSITVKNLTASTAYSFTITSGDENFLNGGSAYQISTGPPLTPSSPSSLVTGKVTNDDGSPASDAIVYLSTSNSQILSTMTNDSGSYTIDLNKMRTNNLASLMNLDMDSPLTLQIFDATKQSKVSVLKGQTNPIPLVILSKDYDFAVSTEPLTPSPVASGSADLSGTPSVSPVAFPNVGEGTNTNPAILTPQKEQGFEDQQPLFRGKAVPNETVTITINSEQTITATVTADDSGNWQYRPNEDLEPGTHTITIRTIDASGLMRIITQSFVVYAEGSQFTEPSVSPSANATNTPTQVPPTATPRATNTPAPTKAGTTATPTPTNTATLTPTKIAAATITATPPPVPVTGNASLTLTIIGLVSVVTIGALLFLFATV